MLKTRLAVLAAACIVSLGLALWSTVLAAPPNDLDNRVSDLMRTWQVPGMAVAIVEDGRIVTAKGYGVRRMGSPQRVTANTVFPVASVGKALTVAGLATLVEQGAIEWDDKVIDRLPGFQMHDAWVTREMTIRDLLVHRSGLGLGAGDLLFVPRSSLSRAETVHRLRYIKPATSFRSSYAYDNVLYIVVGQLIESVTGMSWEEFTAARILKPAGMVTSVAGDDARFHIDDRAYPHARLNGALRGLGDQELLDEKAVLFGANSAPAGGIATSASDLGRWMLIQLAQGKLPDSPGRLFSEASSREMWTPHTPIPIEPFPSPVDAATPRFLSYALGWQIRDYKGRRIVMHKGSEIGFQAVLVLLPEMGTGFALVVNAEETAPLNALMYELLDHYVGGGPERDWSAAFAAYEKQQTDAALENLRSSAPEPANVGPSLALDCYAGDYADAWYGPISIRSKQGKLILDFKQTPGMVGELEHWQYDTFRTRWHDRTIEPAYVTFSLTAEASVERVTMKAVSPLADFSFDYQDLTLLPHGMKPKKCARPRVQACESDSAKCSYQFQPLRQC